MNELIPIDSGQKAIRLYEKMQAAIAECHSLDDCREIATEAAAIAAYHKQLKDDASARKFFQIKLRAWRRIGELLTKIDASGCDGNTAAHIRKIRAAFDGCAAVEEMSDYSIREAIRVAALPADFFEREVGDHKAVYSLIFAYERLQRKLWEASPEGQEEQRQIAKRNERWKAEEDAKAAKRRFEEQKTITEATTEMQLTRALKSSYAEALSEVGVTLDRRDRERMREVIFLIKDSVHAALRQAAFDQRITMQAALRAGLAMWFIAHGYDVPIGEMDLRPPKKR